MQAKTFLRAGYLAISLDTQEGGKDTGYVLTRLDLDVKIAISVIHIYLVLVSEQKISDLVKGC